jgi:hypothetical protein
MRIRNDAGWAQHSPPPLPTTLEQLTKHPYYAPDRVLIRCPDCRRNHLAALTCPPPNARAIQQCGIAVVDEPEWHAEKVAA